MSVSISKLSVLLTASADGFNAVLEQSAHNVETFSERAKAGFEMASGAMALFGAEMTLAKAAESFKDAFESIEKTSHLASELGITTEAMSELEYAAKMVNTDVDELAAAMAHLERNINTINDSSRQTSAAMQSLHLSASALAKLPADKQLEAIAEAMKSTKDQGEKAQAAFELMGKSGFKLLPLLNEGAEGLRRWQEQAKKTGNSISEMDGAKVEAALQSFKGAMSIIEGTQKQLAIAGAPYLQAVSNKLLAMGTSGEGVAKKIVHGFEIAAQGGAYLADSVKIIEAGWHGLSAAVDEATAKALENVLLLSDMLDKVLVKLHQKPTGLTDTIGLMSASMHLQGADEFKKMTDAWDHIGDGHKAVTKFFDDIGKSADEAAKKISRPNLNMAMWESYTKLFMSAQDKITEAQKDLDQVNMSGVQKAVDDLRRLGNKDYKVPDSMLQQYKLLKESTEQAKALATEHAKMLDEASKMWEEARTPIEKYGDEIMKIQQMLSDHLISAETAKRLEDLKTAGLSNQLSSESSFHPVQMVEQGSQAAAHLAAQIDAQQKGADHTRELLNQAKEQVQTMKDVKQLLTDIKAVTGVSLVANF